MSRRDLSVKGGTSERCYRTRRGRADEQWYAIISPYFDGRIKMNSSYPEITNISFLAKLFFKSFISLKHLSDYRTVRLSDRRTIGLSDYRTVGLSDCRMIATAPFLKEVHDELSPMISDLFQSSVNTCTVPTDWREAIVTPAFKKGAKSKPENYRPISLTCILSKVLEHIIVSSIMNHLDNHNFSTVSDQNSVVKHNY